MQLQKNRFFYIIFVLGTLFQVMCAIFGFDMSDEGFVMTLYRDFLEDAELAKTGSGYPVSCIIGWCFSQIIPGNLLAMRMWGVLLVSLHVLIIYSYLKDKIDRRLLSLGLLAMMLVMGNDPKPLGYNNITGILATISIISILEGSFRRNPLLLLTGGMLVGINTLVRLPNVLDISFAAIPLLASLRRWRAPFTKAGLSMSFCVLLGVAAGIAMSWELLCYTGVDKNIIAFFHSVTGQLEGDSTHSTSYMLTKYINNYLLALAYVVFYVFTVAVISFAVNTRTRIGKLVALVAAFLLYQTIYLNCNCLGHHVYAVLNGVGLFGGGVLILLGNARERALGFAAALMSVVLPAGSDQGFVTMWNGTWLSFPVGLAATPLFFSKTGSSISLKLTLKDRNGCEGKRYELISRDVKAGIYMAAVAIILATGYKVYHKCYYDPGNRLAKTSRIASRYARGIYTAEDKAIRFNPLLAELKHYVAAGDTMLIYDWSPMLFYLTNTKPYAGISWPCLYYGQQYVNEIEKAEQTIGSLPVVVLQHYRCIDDLNENYYDPDEAFDASHRVMIECVNRFVGKHHYRKVWSNRWFDILLPPERERLKEDSNDW